MKWIAAIVLVLGSLAGAAPVPLLKLADGDRVVFVGATLVERDQQFGYFETMLHARFPKATFSFRNLGWSGDTVWGEARAEFGSQADGYKKLVDEVVAAKPTVLILNYGVNESFAGEKGLNPFLAQYDTLLKDLTKTGAAIWLMGPNRLEDLGRPLPDPAAHNEDVKRYNLAIRKLANQRGYGVIDLFSLVKQAGAVPQTSDEMHYTAEGAKPFAAAVIGQMTGQKVNIATDAAFEAVREKTIEKNHQFFYRWRPQNDTYIFGFRKHEQGQNAVEIPQFDPIVEKMETEIAALSKTLHS